MTDDAWGFAGDCIACGGSGYTGHDCGEDTCSCAIPEENIVCVQCNGTGVIKDEE